MDKGIASIEQQLCPVCCKPFDTDNMLFQNKDIRNPKLKSRTVTGWSQTPCKDCFAEFKGRIILIGADESKSELNEHGCISPEKAHRTGEVIGLRTDDFKNIFNVEPAPVNFVSQEVIEKLKEMVGELSDGCEGPEKEDG